MNQPSSKCVLITGASSGIGYATAEYFLSKGWNVYGLSRSGGVPSGVHAVKANINEPATLALALQNIYSTTQRLDVVVHAAGIGGAAPVECFPIEEAQKIMTTNFFGSVNVAQACLPYLRKQSSSSLIFVSSIAGLISVPFHGIYSASKFATEAIVECLRLELSGSGVKIISVCPGDTATSIISHQYRSKVDDVLGFYKKNYKKADQAMRDNVDKGMSPVYLASKIYAIAHKKAPKMHYPIGPFLQKIAPFAKKILPSRVFEFIMKKYYGLSTK